MKYKNSSHEAIYMYIQLYCRCIVQEKPWELLLLLNVVEEHDSTDYNS